MNKYNCNIKTVVEKDSATKTVRILRIRNMIIREAKHIMCQTSSLEECKEKIDTYLGAWLRSCHISNYQILLITTAELDWDNLYPGVRRRLLAGLWYTLSLAKVVYLVHYEKRWFHQIFPFHSSYPSTVTQLDSVRIQLRVYKEDEEQIDRTEIHQYMARLEVPHVEKTLDLQITFR